MPLKTNDPRICYALDQRISWSNEEILVVIVCTSAAAAGQVVVLSLGRSLFPGTHFRIAQTDHDEITIIVMHTLSTEQVAQMRAEIAPILGARIV